jgi:hypothetical protein
MPPGRLVAQGVTHPYPIWQWATILEGMALGCVVDGIRVSRGWWGLEDVLGALGQLCHTTSLGDLNSN